MTKRKRQIGEFTEESSSYNNMTDQQIDELMAALSDQSIVDEWIPLITEQERPLKKSTLSNLYSNFTNEDLNLPTINLIKLLLHQTSENKTRNLKIAIATELVARCKHQDNGIRTETQECITKLNTDIHKHPPLIALYKHKIPFRREIAMMLFDALDDGFKQEVRNDVEAFKINYTSFDFNVFWKNINLPDDHPTKIIKDFLEKNLENRDLVIKTSPAINLVALLLSQKVEKEQKRLIAAELVARCGKEKCNEMRTETQGAITKLNTYIHKHPPLIALYTSYSSGNPEIAKTLFDALDHKLQRDVRNDVKVFREDHVAYHLDAFWYYINKPIKSDESNDSDENESASLDTNNDEIERQFDEFMEKLYSQCNNETTDESYDTSIANESPPLLLAEQKPPQNVQRDQLDKNIANAKIKEWLIDGNSKNIDSVIEISPTLNLIKLLLSQEVVEEQRLKIATELVARCNSQGIGIRKETQKYITEVNSNISENPPLIALFQNKILGRVKISEMLFDALDEASKEKVRDAVKGFKITYPLSKNITPLEKYINQSDNHSTNSDEANSIDENEFPYGGEFEEMFPNIPGLDSSDECPPLSGEVMMDLS